MPLQRMSSPWLLMVKTDPQSLEGQHLSARRAPERSVYARCRRMTVGGEIASNRRDEQR